MWRLNDPTAMAAPSLYPSLQIVQRKICQLPQSSATYQWLRAVSKSALVAVKFRCLYRSREAAISSKGWSVGTECDDIEFLFFFYSFPIGFGLAVFVATHVNYAISVKAYRARSPAIEGGLRCCRIPRARMGKL